jgi:hypothetical protein
MRLRDIVQNDAALLACTKTVVLDAADPFAQQRAVVKNQQKQLTIKKQQIAAQQAQRKNNAAQAALSKARSKP